MPANYFNFHALLLHFPTPTLLKIVIMPSWCRREKGQIKRTVKIFFNYRILFISSYFRIKCPFYLFAVKQHLNIVKDYKLRKGEHYLHPFYTARTLLPINQRIHFAGIWFKAFSFKKHLKRAACHLQKGL